MTLNKKQEIHLKALLYFGSSEFLPPQLAQAFVLTLSHPLQISLCGLFVNYNTMMVHVASKYRIWWPTKNCTWKLECSPRRFINKIIYFQLKASEGCYKLSPKDRTLNLFVNGQKLFPPSGLNNFFCHNTTNNPNQLVGVVL